MKYMELCKGRHNIPEAVDGAVFPNAINPLNVSEIELQAFEVVKDFDALTLYVTGLSVALVAVINACHTCGVSLNLMHFDRESGNYYCQTVV